jgi:FAD/FMN-containing dehydrogenase
MNDMPQEALKTIKESFGTRFVEHAAGEASAEETFASVFPAGVEEVQLLARLAAQYSLPLVARGAGTALHPGKAPRALAVRFDAMRQIRLSAGEEENWVEVEPGVTWWALEERLRERGMGPRVYPTSAPRSTVGGWLAENGIGVGSYEYGWLLQNVLSIEVVLAGGEQSIIEGSEALRHFVGSRGSMGFVVRAWLATRHASADVPVAALFRDARDLGKAILDLDRGGVPLWHLGFLNAAMARARRVEGPMLFGAYPKERAPWVEPALQSVVESHRGDILPRKEAQRVWEQRFFPATPLGPTPTPGRAFVRGPRLASTLVELERKLAGVAIQGSMSRWGEVALLAFDPAEGSTGVVDLSSVTDAELVEVAGRSWMPRRR